MTPRQKKVLMEKLAHAADFNFNDTIEDEWGRFYGCYADDTAQTTYVWDPIDNDSDALRLAVKRLNWPFGGRAFDDAVTTLFAVGKLPKDPHAATRLGICYAVINSKEHK